MYDDRWIEREGVAGVGGGAGVAGSEITHNISCVVAKEKLIVLPSVAKFAGYEINKLNIIRVKLQNRTAAAVRVHVLPFTNQHFSTKMSLKGLLLPHAVEDLFIYFRPTQYK